MPAIKPIWRNWHETVTQPLTRFEVVSNPDESRSTVAGYNATTRVIQNLILEAAEQETSLRAVGGAWSFTNIAATTGIMIATQRLNYRFSLSPDMLGRPYAADRAPVFVQCGISIADLNKYLASRGQAVPTSGASNGQTIAGALATGTHGAAVRIGSVPDYVVAIHIAAGPAGQTTWLERSSYPVLTDAAITRLNAQVVRDDELFNAALVSFGCFGIVLGVVIEPVPLYYLHGWRQEVDLDQQMWDAITTQDFTGSNLPGARGRAPYHLELLRNAADANARTMMTVMYHEPTRPQGAGSARPGKFGKGDSALDVIGILTDAVPGTTRWASALFAKAYGPYADVAGTPGEIFKDTSTRGRGASSAMGVPLEQAQRAFEIACRIVQDVQAPALVAMRFVKATSATLGFTLHRQITAVIEVDGAYSNATLQAQQDVWAAFEQEGIPYTFHWGKMNNLDATRVRRRFGDDRVNRWIIARRQIIAPECRRVFANSFSDQLDLSR